MNMVRVSAVGDIASCVGFGVCPFVTLVAQLEGSYFKIGKFVTFPEFSLICFELII